MVVWKAVSKQATAGMSGNCMVTASRPTALDGRARCLDRQAVDLRAWWLLRCVVRGRGWLPLPAGMARRVTTTVLKRAARRRMWRLGLDCCGGGPIKRDRRGKRFSARCQVGKSCRVVGADVIVNLLGEL
jgi:hypothetical protein